MNKVRFAIALLIIALGWNTLAAGMRAVKALDHRISNQLELLAE
jgi:hypothetical protein